MRVRDCPIILSNIQSIMLGRLRLQRGMHLAHLARPPLGRMDAFVNKFQEAGGSMVMLAKGNRSKMVVQTCKKHGGFYLGSIGGSAARLAQNCIKKVELLEYEDLGMEAIRKIEVENFPAFIITDDKGNDFFLGDGAA